LLILIEDSITQKIKYAKSGYSWEGGVAVSSSGVNEVTIYSDCDQSSHLTA